jgi:hypothetical protein
MKFTRLTGKLLFERRFKKEMSKISGSMDLLDTKATNDAITLRKTFGKDMSRSFYSKPSTTSLTSELAAKAGRSTEKATFTRLQKKYPDSKRSLIRAFKIAEIKGQRKVAAVTKRLDIPSPASEKMQWKKWGTWQSRRPLIDKDSPKAFVIKGTTYHPGTQLSGGRKLQKFETYMRTKTPKHLRQKPMQKTFLRNDDPKRGLKSMRLDKEGSHMQTYGSEGRSIGGSNEPINMNFDRYKKSQLVKMSKGQVAKGQKPFTNSQKVAVMAAGKKGLKSFIDVEIPTGDTALIAQNYLVKVGKNYHKRYGKFNLPTNTKNFASNPSTPIPEFTEKIKVFGSKTKKVTTTGTYKWRKGKRNKMYVIE